MIPLFMFPPKNLKKPETRTKHSPLCCLKSKHTDIIRRMKWLLAVLLTLSGVAAMQDSSGYVGPEACASCHAGISESYKAVSMSQTFAPISEVPVLEDWTTNNRFYHKPSNQHFVMSTRGGKFYQRRYQIAADGREVNTFEQEIHYALGSGRKERDYLHRTAAGELLQLPVVWYSQEKAWGIAPGYDHANHYNFSRRIVYRCMFCHNAYPDLPQAADRYEAGQAIYPANLPRGIDCERCHGPGARHAREATAASIVNPGKLSRKLEMDVCMQCHLETTSEALPNSVLKLGRSVFSYRPGEPLEDYAVHFDYADPQRRRSFNIVHQAYRLRQSECYQKSSMTCTTCHNPHQRPEEKSSHIRATCQGCHTTTPPHGEDCTSCHMPQRRTDDVVHVVMTDHHIQRRPPADPLRMKTEGAPPPYRGGLSFYLPEPHRDLYLGMALSRGANLQRGLALLEAARPQPHFELAAAYARAGSHEKAAAAYRRGLVGDPTYAEGWYNLGLSLLASDKNAEALAAFDEALKQRPTLADAHVGRGLVATREGRMETARAAYSRAVQIDPVNVTALLNLAALEKQAGNAGRAAEYQREADRINGVLPR